MASLLYWLGPRSTVQSLDGPISIQMPQTHILAPCSQPQAWNWYSESSEALVEVESELISWNVSLAQKNDPKCISLWEWLIKFGCRVWTLDQVTAEGSQRCWCGAGTILSLSKQKAWSSYCFGKGPMGPSIWSFELVLSRVNSAILAWLLFLLFTIPSSCPWPSTHLCPDTLLLGAQLVPGFSCESDS